MMFAVEWLIPLTMIAACSVLLWMQVGELAGLAVGSAVCITSIFAG
jgi:hypothetical protein